MHVQNPGQPILLASDWRQKADKDLDFTEPNDAPHVLELWRFGEKAMGRSVYRKVSRLALFDHDAMPSTAEAAQQRAAFLQHIEHEKPRLILLIPTPDAQMGETASSLRGTHVWNALKAPDSLPAMRGCRWQFTNDTAVLPLYPIASRVKELQRWVMASWLAKAEKAPQFSCQRLYSELSPEYTQTMGEMAGRPLAVDLEFIPSRDLVTAIGLSDGIRAASIPWARYKPTNARRIEHALGAQCRHLGHPELEGEILKILKELLAAPTPKYAHNFVADIPRLNKLGFEVNGETMDTFAAHAIAFPELPHGLQAACASLFTVPPWKSLYKPRRWKNWKTLTRDDEEFWICDPQALRAYNCQDAFMTWHLAQHVFPWIGIDPYTGADKQ